jgi:hypothetical protein
MKNKNKYIYYYEKENDPGTEWGCDVMAYSSAQAELLFKLRHKNIKYHVTKIDIWLDWHENKGVRVNDQNNGPEPAAAGKGV